MFKHTLAKSAVALAAALSLQACSSGGDSGTPPPSGTATIRFANGQKADALPYLLYMDGAVQGSAAVAYKAAGSCQTVAAGSHAFAFREQGASASLPSLNAVTLTADKRYTVFATGVSTVPRGLVLEDDFGATVAGQAKLRVLNATNQAISFDIYVGGTSGGPLGSITSADVDFQEFPVLTVTPGTVLVRWTLQGGTTVVGTQTITMAAGDQRTLVITVTPTSGAQHESFVVTPCTPA